MLLKSYIQSAAVFLFIVCFIKYSQYYKYFSCFGDKHFHVQSTGVILFLIYFIKLLPILEVFRFVLEINICTLRALLLFYLLFILLDFPNITFFWFWR